MANIGTFGDEFSGSALSASWATANTPNVTVSGGLLTLQDTGTPLGVAYTTETWTWAGSSLTVKFDSATINGGSANSAPFIGPWAADSTTRYCIGCAFGNQPALYRATASGGYVGSNSFSTGTHEYARLRFTGGNMLFETSTDGSAWTLQHTVTSFDGSAYNGLALGIYSDSAGATPLDSIIATESASIAAPAVGSKLFSGLSRGLIR